MQEDAIDQPADPRREIALRLTVLARMLRSDFDRHVDVVGLTRSQFSLIAAVARRPGSTQRQISEMLEMSEASAGRLVDRLVAEGLLERRELEGDRRARAVFLTAAAQPLLDKMSEMARRREERWFRGMSNEELSQVRDLLDRIYCNISPMPVGAGS